MLTKQNKSTPASDIESSRSAAVGKMPDLPDIDDKPGTDVVIYDGQCNFCRAQVEKLNWFSGGRLSFISLHDPRVGERFPDLNPEALMQQMYVVSPDGDRYAGAAAIRYLTRRLPRLWLAAPLLHLPFSLPAWQAAYDWIARNRYRIAGRSCDSGTCQTHFDRTHSGR